MSAMEWKTLSVDVLRPAAYNPRKKLKAGDKEYEKIKNSILEFGYVEPIIVNYDMTVIGGHQRLTVLKDLGYTEVQCVVVHIEDEHKVKALNIALNKITGAWNEQLLADLLVDLQSVDFNTDLTGFEALVDAIDGVDFEVPINMNYDDPYQDLHIHFNAGMQHLTGEEAMKVVRFRHNNDGSGYGNEDIGRMQTQQAFLKAVAQQTLTLSNLDKIDDFVKIFQQYVETDLTLGNLAWLGKEAISMGAENISFSTLPGEWHSPYIYLDPDATLEVVNQYLNPYVEDRTMEDLNIPA